MGDDAWRGQYSTPSGYVYVDQNLCAFKWEFGGTRNFTLHLGKDDLRVRMRNNTTMFRRDSDLLFVNLRDASLARDDDGNWILVGSLSIARPHEKYHQCGWTLMTKISSEEIDFVH